MFDQLLKDPHALARQGNGPLAEERLRYLAHCAGQEMAVKTLLDIATYLLAAAKVLRLAERPADLITRDEVEAAADRWVSRHSAKPTARTISSSWRKFTRYALRWLAFLGRLRLPTPPTWPHAELISRFADAMRQERGLSPRTIDSRCRAAQDFVVQLSKIGLQLDTVTVADIDDILARKAREGSYSRVTVRSYADRIRAFLRYAEGVACCSPGLAAAVMTPRVYRDEAIPAGPAWEDVKRLLAMTEGSRPTDIRTRAGLMLLVVYGLRSGEVVGLRLDDFDWEQELLTIRNGKSRRPRTYPLCRTVGHAVLRYLREARPRSDRRELFLNLRSPFGPMCCSDLGYLVRSRLRALSVTLRHYGPHALRHACATHLLQQGLSLKEIGDHLGHTCPEATRHYAKVDLVGLRSVGDLDLEGLL